MTATKSMVDIEVIVIINEKTWQGLTDEQRQIMNTAAARVEKELRDQMAQLEAESFEFSKGKIKIIELNDEQMAQWQQLSKPVVEAFIKDAGPLGQQVVDAARAIK